VSQLQTGQLANEADLIKLRGLQRVNRIQLFLALGGSFDQAPATIPESADSARSGGDALHSSIVLRGKDDYVEGQTDDRN